MYDVVIVGGSAAGLTAGIYASRRNLSTVIITKEVGGQTASTPSIENYPGFEDIGGPELIDRMRRQCEKVGTEIIYDEVSQIEKVGERDFAISTQSGKQYKAKSVILAFGKTPRSLGVKGEAQYLGRGVSYCVTCDAPLFKRKTVAVIGGGNSAIEGALMLSTICEKVYLIHRRSEFRGEAVLVERLNQADNIEKILNKVPVEIIGDDQRVRSMKLSTVADGASRADLIDDALVADQEILVDGIFVEIGFMVSNSLIAGLIDIDNLNQVLVDNNQATSLPGVFAAGDVTNTPYKQVVIAASEGAKAALSAYTYVTEGKKTKADWGGH